MCPNRGPSQHLPPQLFFREGLDARLGRLSGFPQDGGRSMPGLRSKKPLGTSLNLVAKHGLRVTARPVSARAQTDESLSTRAPTTKCDPDRLLPDPSAEPLLEFVSLPGSRSHSVGDKPYESRIGYIAEVTHGAPEFQRPRMFVFDERRDSRGASFKKGCTYFSD